MSSGDRFDRPRKRSAGDRFDHPYRRRPGDTIIYTPEQTERYKSMWERYQKSLCMRPDFVEEKDGKTIYKFNSPRSPSGTWDVFLDAGLGIISADAVPTAEVSFSLYEFNYTKTEKFTPSQGILGNVNYNYAVDLIAIDTDPATYRAFVESTIELTPDIKSIRLRSSWKMSIQKIGSAFPVNNLFYSAGGFTDIAPPGEYEFAGEFEFNFVTADFGTTINLFLFIQKGFVSFSPGRDGARIIIDQTVEILEIDGQLNEGEYNCTCPDFSKKIDGFTSKFQDDSPSCEHNDGDNNQKEYGSSETIYTSEITERNWENSQAGTPEYCKHILATMRFRGEPIPKYTDIPVDASDTSNYTEPLVNDGFPRTEEFDFRPWNNNPGRTKKPRDIKRRGSSW